MKRRLLPFILKQISQVHLGLHDNRFYSSRLLLHFTLAYCLLLYCDRCCCHRCCCCCCWVFFAHTPVRSIPCGCCRSQTTLTSLIYFLFFGPGSMWSRDTERQHQHAPHVNPKIKDMPNGFNLKPCIRNDFCTFPSCSPLSLPFSLFARPKFLL